MISVSSEYYSSLVPNMLDQTIDTKMGCLTLIERLGEGAYGVVYRAVDLNSPTSSSNPDPKQYAVKVLLKAAPDTCQAQLQRREVLAHKIVSGQPNILTLHQVIEEPDFLYLITDYCPGGDLYSAIVDYRKFCGKDDLIKKVFIQILDAVQSCHDKGIYHRDLKPDNIFCMNKEASEIVIGDFGLATKSTKSETFGCGSGYYISPECLGLEFGNRPYAPVTCDVWALGIIFCNMVVGRAPWRRATTDDQCFLHFMADPDYMRKVLPLSEAADAILKRTLTFDPNVRVKIPELRKMILEADTFFMSPEEVQKGNRILKLIAASYSANDRYSLYSADLHAISREQAEFDRTDNLVDGVIVKDPAGFFQIVNAIGSTTAGFANAHYPDSDSDDESEGPVTPERRAQDSRILVAVPDLPEGDDMGAAVVSVVGEKAKQGMQRESLVECMARFAL